MTVKDRIKAWLWKWRFNLFPAYFGSGGRVTYISPDWREVLVTIPLSWRTRNYVGTTFGGSMYAAVDPIYMMMLIQVLGPGYVVWDKAASVRFLRPGTGTLYARFHLRQEEIDAVRTGLQQAAAIDRVYQVELTDRDGAVRAVVEKTVYVRAARTATVPTAA